MNKINSDQEKQICHHPRDYTVEFCLYIFSTGCGERFMVPVAPKCHLPLHLGSPQGHTAFLRSSVILLSSHRDERMHSSLHSTDLPTSSELGTVPPLFPRASLDAFEKKKKVQPLLRKGCGPLSNIKCVSSPQAHHLASFSLRSHQPVPFTCWNWKALLGANGGSQKMANGTFGWKAVPCWTEQSASCNARVKPLLTHACEYSHLSRSFHSQGGGSITTGRRA